jgi:hypothetical protein
MHPRWAKVDNSLLLLSMLFFIGAQVFTSLGFSFLTLFCCRARRVELLHWSIIGQGKTFDAIVCFPYFCMV